MKTLAEIAIEAGLVTKAQVAKAGKISEDKKLPLVAVLVRELGVDEVALIAALRKQTRVPLLDPAQIQVDSDALRLVERDVCARLRVLPLQLAIDGDTKVMRVAMADPTDTSAILELEELVRCEIEVTALPLSAIEELVERGYKQTSTAVVQRRVFSDNLFVTARPSRSSPSDTTPPASSDEISVTTEIPLSSLQEAPLDTRLKAVCQLLVSKGLISEAELAEAVRKLLGKDEP